MHANISLVTTIKTYIYISFSLSLSLSLSLCLSLSLSLSLSISLSLSLCLSLSLYLSIHFRPSYLSLSSLLSFSPVLSRFVSFLLSIFLCLYSSLFPFFPALHFPLCRSSSALPSPLFPLLFHLSLSSSSSPSPKIFPRPFRHKFNTVSQALEVSRAARKADLALIVGYSESGPESMDTFIADLCVAIGAGQLTAGGILSGMIYG